jgi:hypothetical protein
MRKHSPCVAVQIMLSYDVLPCFATSIQVEGGANVQNRLMRQSVGRHGSRLLRQLSSGAANISSIGEGEGAPTACPYLTGALVGLHLVRIAAGRVPVANLLPATKLS